MVMTIVMKETIVRTLKAGEFKAKCLTLMDEVERTGEAVVITKRGRPVAQLAPLSRRPGRLFGALAGSFEIRGDIVAPIDVAWEAMG